MYKLHLMNIISKYCYLDTKVRLKMSHKYLYQKIETPFIPNDYLDQYLCAYTLNIKEWLLELIRNKCLPTSLKINFFSRDKCHDDIGYFIACYIKNEDDETNNYIFRSLLYAKHNKRFYIKIPKYLSYYSKEKMIRLIKVMDLDMDTLLHFHNFCSGQISISIRKIYYIEVLECLQSLINWNYYFYLDLQNEIQKHGDFIGPNILVNCVDKVWSKYKSYLPQLSHPKTKEKWNLISRNPQFEEIYEFIHELVLPIQSNENNQY